MLLLLFAAAFVSGLLMWVVGSGWGRWPTILHGAIGVAIVGISPWKSFVSRRGIRRRGVGPAVPALVLSLLVVIALVTGFAHRAGRREAGPLLVMQIHVGAALVAVPLGLWHVAVRPVRPRRSDVSRRNVLRGALLGGGATAVTLAVPHAGRAVTRSLERGSFEPSAMPVTQWLFDAVPRLDRAVWRLQVGERLWSLDDLERVGDTHLDATLDCTGGWYANQRWTGIPLDRLFALSAVPKGSSIEVRSVTGYSRRFPHGDAANLLLAVQVGGEPLSPAHGFPARLVAPNRRGFWWVKWVEQISVDGKPWWWQPPLPLS